MYKVIVFFHKTKRSKNLPYDEACVYFDRMVEKYGEDRVFLVSCSKPYPPPGRWYRHNNFLWCPYCGEKRLFRYSPRNRIHCCKICGTSERDHWVRKFNGLKDKLKGRR